MAKLATRVSDEKRTARCSRARSSSSQTARKCSENRVQRSRVDTRLVAAAGKANKSRGKRTRNASVVQQSRCFSQQGSNDLFQCGEFIAADALKFVAEHGSEDVPTGLAGVSGATEGDSEITPLAKYLAINSLTPHLDTFISPDNHILTIRKLRSLGAPKAVCRAKSKRQLISPNSSKQQSLEQMLQVVSEKCAPMNNGQQDENAVPDKAGTEKN